MNITFYNNTSEKNVLNKTLSNPLVLAGTLRESTSVIRPTIVIESSIPFVGYNYCYIPDFARFYFVIDVSSVRENIWSVTLRVDVLMSFKNDILNTPAIIDHTTEGNTTHYMDSDVWQRSVKDKTDIINFSNGLSESGGYVLITAGG